MRSPSCTTANLCQKVDNSDQISSKSKLFKQALTVDSKKARSKHEKKMKEAEKKGGVIINGNFAHAEQCHTRLIQYRIRNAAKNQICNQQKEAISSDAISEVSE